MKLYHCAGARSFRPLWALEELGLDYELEVMPFPPRFARPGYLEVNPLGTVPAFTDGDLLMTESSAICHYLGTAHGPSDLVVGAGEADYGRYLNFLHMSDATLTFPQTIHLRYTVLEPEERRLPQAAADYAQWFASRLRGALKLMGPDYACAGRFTMADIAVGYAVLLANAIGLAAAVPPAAQDYFARVSDRDGFRRAIAKESGR
ncbi:glutathione S-transferase family protein [Zavarzinia compransoris]|uniref:Glutathione S-transferase n=1 Tax=Zavarzinia compransoris TaxID=1264899 RepID=A0A317EE46_9PROT|nr:glutathione S-transferase [Zavarzinia compransoris]PWR23623.1 glutathione S-transferase [Zavarzinia compransoris]TDP47842.1 glutathione S-transferase [Zavarzinia compransoris]